MASPGPTNGGKVLKPKRTLPGATGGRGKPLREKEKKKHF